MIHSGSSFKKKTKSSLISSGNEGSFKEHSISEEAYYFCVGVLTWKLRLEDTAGVSKSRLKQVF